MVVFLLKFFYVSNSQVYGRLRRISRFPPKQFYNVNHRRRVWPQMFLHWSASQMTVTFITIEASSIFAMKVKELFKNCLVKSFLPKMKSITGTKNGRVGCLFPELRDLTIPMCFSRGWNFARPQKMKNTGLPDAKIAIVNKIFQICKTKKRSEKCIKIQIWPDFD